MVYSIVIIQQAPPAFMALYRSSRWTSGNFWFPDYLEILPDGIHYTKARLLGKKEEQMNYQHIASVNVNSGIFFANIRIDSSGGHVPIRMKGLGKKDGNAIRQSIFEIQRQNS